ncbi:MAG: low specificity L-threonine aldolase [Marinicellaceae bacterium]
MRESKYLNYTHDHYNSGELVTRLEEKTAQLLGKKKALFFHKGVAAQLVALKVSAELQNNNKVILHPNSHIAVDESNAYQQLMGLTGIELGSVFEPFNEKEVSNVTEKAASLVVELPLRRAGFKLTPWNELLNMQQWAKDTKTHFHLDGARLWESTHFYQKSVGEISTLFDSVYVSFYKGLGGLSGAILSGNSDFIDKCKVWRSRIAGDLYSAFPMLITALEGLDNELIKIPNWVMRAQEIAKLLNAIEGISVDKPHTNGFLVYVEGDLGTLNKKAQFLSEQLNLKLFFKFMPTEMSHIQKAELQVGSGSDDVNNDEIIQYFTSLMSN